MSTLLSAVSPLVLALVVAGTAAPPPPSVPVPGAAATRAGTVRVHQYRLSGRIRPLLVWMGRDDVGFARVAWQSSDEGRPGYELLIGTDPSRAPRGINRWGFVSEQATAEGGDVLALMTGAMAGSFAEAKADTTSGPPGARLRVLRGRIADGLAQGRATQMGFDRAPTIHDVEAVLARLRYDAATARTSDARARPDARPGLLTAIADTLGRLVPAARHAQSGLQAAAGPPVPYVFGRDSYELRVRAVKSVTAATRGAAAARAIETDFEILTIATGARTRFWMRTALDGDLAGVPLAVRWQPRWWLEIGLHLTE